MHGVITQFDGHIGRGVVRGADGSDYGFHCVQIADGSRTIAVATEVDFDTIPGPLGRWEAAQIGPR